jgi:hypothetical protein
MSARPFRVVALLSAYNEGDVIAPVLERLVSGGVEAYLLDHHSTDDTVAQARAFLGRGLLAIETFPEESGFPPELANALAWRQILMRKEELARTLDADWFVHHDADEVRDGPFPGKTFAEAIRWVDGLGYDAVDFRLLNFRPVDDGFTAGTDPAEYFTRYEDGDPFDRVQVKCWKKGSAPVDLVTSGGHDAMFPGRRVFPVKFLLRHYPFRSQAHGERKVFAERKTRFLPEERALHWHVQYDAITPEHRFVRDPAGLKRFDLDAVRLELLLENERVAETRARAAASQAALTEQADALRARVGELGRDLERKDEVLRTALETLSSRVAGVETRLAEVAPVRADVAEVHAGIADARAEVADVRARIIGALERFGGDLADLAERTADAVDELRAGVSRHDAALGRLDAAAGEHGKELGRLDDVTAEHALGISTLRQAVTARYHAQERLERALLVPLFRRALAPLRNEGKHIGELTPGRRVIQELEVPPGGFRGVSVLAGTFGRANSCRLTLAVRRSPEAPVLRSAVAEGWRYAHDAFVEFRFEPVLEPGPFVLELGSPDAMAGAAMTLFVQPGRGLTVDGVVRPQSLVLTLLGPDA